MVFEEHAALRAYLRAVPDRVETEDRCPAERRLKQTEKEMDGRRLSGAVRTQQRKDAPGGDFERSSVHCPDGTEGAGEVFAHDRVHAGCDQSGISGSTRSTTRI